MPNVMKSPAFQFYPADFLADENVAMMTNQEIGCYIKLMCYCWREGSIPKEISKIAKLCGEDSLAMAKLWLSISPCFSIAIADPSRLLHHRLESERVKQENFRKERSESGKKGAEAKRAAAFREDSSAIAQPIAEHIANDSSSSSSLSLSLTSSLTATSKSKSKSKPTVANAPRGERETCFDQFWEAYPAKVGRGDAIKAWKKITSLIPETLELILQALSWQRDCPAWLKNDGQYIPNPATYLNGKRWLDEPRKQSPPGTTEVGRHNAAAVDSWLKSQPMGNVYEND